MTGKAFQKIWVKDTKTYHHRWKKVFREEGKRSPRLPDTHRKELVIYVFLSWNTPSKYKVSFQVRYFPNFILLYTAQP